MPCMSWHAWQCRNSQNAVSDLKKCTLKLWRCTVLQITYKSAKSLGKLSHRRVEEIEVTKLPDIFLGFKEYIESGTLVG